LNLKVGCLHPVACTRSGSGFPSNATLVWIFYSVTATCFGLMTIFRRKYISPEDGQKTETCSAYWIKYSHQCCVKQKPWTWRGNRSITFFRHLILLLPEYTASHTTSQQSEQSQLRQAKIKHSVQLILIATNCFWTACGLLLASWGVTLLTMWPVRWMHARRGGSSLDKR
jgi:hypothetical protein